MKKLMFSLLLIVGCAAQSIAQVNPNNHYVNGYYRSNGTYVQGHYKTDPNSTVNDNYSTYPNVNPYTGTQGTVQPDYSGTTNWNSTPTFNSTPTYQFEAPTYELETPSLDTELNFYDPF